MSQSLSSLDLTFKDLPNFANITAADIKPMTHAMLAQAQSAVEQLTAIKQHDFDSLVPAHEELLHQLASRWSPITHLNNVGADESWQREYAQALADITEFLAKLGQDERIFAAYERVQTDADVSADPVRSQLVRHALRNFRLAGVGLSDDKKARFRELMQILTANQTEFANNVQRCTDEWQWHCTDEAQLAGIPATLLSAAQDAARAANKTGWLFGLTQPVYQAVITHATSRTTRERFYRAWMTRAASNSEHHSSYDNDPLITKILAARTEMAQLLDFDSYADYSLAAKMAGTVPEVTDFLTDLASKSTATGQAELAQLQSIADHPVASWDTAFYTEQLKERNFNISDETLRPYFPAEKALEGLFGLAEQLYGLSVERVENVSSWDPSVDFLVLRDREQNVIGGFYADLIARPGKRGGAWIDECIVRKMLPLSASLPVGYLVCNFTPPSQQTPSLLTHNDLVTLFHEFGHMLHHLLTQVDYPSIAGINGVPWDAVELPSQFMENFAWHYDVLKTCTGHIETDEPLPRALFDRLLASRNTGAGMQMLRQLEFALFDFGLHARTDGDQPGVVQSVLSQTRTQTSVVTPPDWARFENSFTHIFAGGYAAGYYSYKWAEVLAADAFSAFEESGNVFDATTAARFRSEILEIGGSRDIHDAFVAFRGRQPQIEPLLLSNGIRAA